MSKTVADASRDYRQRQRAKLERYEAALKEIAAHSRDSATVKFALSTLDQ